MYSHVPFPVCFLVRPPPPCVRWLCFFFFVSWLQLSFTNDFFFLAQTSSSPLFPHVPVFRTTETFLPTPPPVFMVWVLGFCSFCPRHGFFIDFCVSPSLSYVAFYPANSCSCFHAAQPTISFWSIVPSPPLWFPQTAAFLFFSFYYRPTSFPFYLGLTLAQRFAPVHSPFLLTRLPPVLSAIATMHFSFFLHLFLFPQVISYFPFLGTFFHPECHTSFHFWHPRAVTPALSGDNLVPCLGFPTNLFWWLSVPF